VSLYLTPLCSYTRQREAPKAQGEPWGRGAPEVDAESLAWIEEPTLAADVVGHALISRATQGGARYLVEQCRYPHAPRAVDRRGEGCKKTGQAGSGMPLAARANP